MSKYEGHLDVLRHRSLGGGTRVTDVVLSSPHDSTTTIATVYHSPAFDQRWLVIV
jgi:hypothetical protein